MDFEKFTERARGFVQSAQSLALREGHQRSGPEHSPGHALVDIAQMAVWRQVSSVLQAAIRRALCEIEAQL